MMQLASVRVARVRTCVVSNGHLAGDFLGLPGLPLPLRTAGFQFADQRKIPAAVDVLHNQPPTVLQMAQRMAHGGL